MSSEFRSFSCWVFNLSTIALKSLLVFPFQCLLLQNFVYLNSSPISDDADIKLFIEMKNLDENLIAIVDKNNRRVTIIM